MYAGAIFQDLRFQTACEYHVPIEGVFISNDRESFTMNWSGAKIICSLNNQSAPNLDRFIEAARRIPGEYLSGLSTNITLISSDQARIAVEYRILGEESCSRDQRVHVDRRYLRAKMLLRSRKDNDTANWQTTDLGPAPPADPLPYQTLPLEPTT